MVQPYLTLHSLFDTSQVIVQGRSNITTVLSDLLAVLSVQNGLATLIHLQFSDLDIAGRDSTENFLLVGLLHLAALSFNVDDILLTVHLHDLSLAALSLSTQDTDLIILADRDGANLKKEMTTNELPTLESTKEKFLTWCLC